MNHETIREILNKTDCVRFCASPEEKAAAAYLEELCSKLGVKACQESFDVDTAEMHTAQLTADGREIPCNGYLLCGSGCTEAPLCYAGAKINLNISLRSIVNGIPLRCFDIMGCGGFLLSSYQADSLSFFTPDEDFVYYDSYEDLMTKCEYYLSHEKERLEIARNALEKVKQYHTYDVRIDEMFG